MFKGLGSGRGAFTNRVWLLGLSVWGFAESGIVLDLGSWAVSFCWTVKGTSSCEQVVREAILIWALEYHTVILFS